MHVFEAKTRKQICTKYIIFLQKQVGAPTVPSAVIRGSTRLNTTEPQCPHEVKNVRGKNIILLYFFFLVEIVANGSLIMVICLKTV
jgi:hypothetical protein